MAEDNSDIMNTINSFLQNNSIPDNVKESLKSFADSSSASTDSSISPEFISQFSELFKNSNNSGNDSGSPNNFNFDINTILKMKKVIEQTNSKDDPRSNLLLSLKPYLNEHRKGQVEQYIQFFNMSKVIDLFGKINNEKKD